MSITSISSDYIVGENELIEDIEIEDFNEYLDSLLVDYGQRGVLTGYLLLWTRMGIPQRLYLLGFDETTSLHYSDTLLNLMLVNVVGHSQEQLHCIFPELPLNHICLVFSTTLLEKLNQGMEMVGNRIEDMMDEETSADQLWDNMLELEATVESISHIVADTVMDHYCIPDYYIRVVDSQLI